MRGVQPDRLPVLLLRLGVPAQLLHEIPVRGRAGISMFTVVGMTQN